MNAIVEAAQAGEQGRGFAVVAGEARALAQCSAQAVREIKSLVTVSVEHVESGTRVVTGAGGTVRELVGNARRMNKLLAEIATAAPEQSGGVVQVCAAVTELGRPTQQNAALVEQTTTARSAWSFRCAWSRRPGCTRAVATAPLPARRGGIGVATEGC